MPTSQNPEALDELTFGSRPSHVRHGDRESQFAGGTLDVTGAERRSVVEKKTGPDCSGPGHSINWGFADKLVVIQARCALSRLPPSALLAKHHQCRRQLR